MVVLTALVAIIIITAMVDTINGKGRCGRLCVIQEWILINGSTPTTGAYDPFSGANHHRTELATTLGIAGHNDSGNPRVDFSSRLFFQEVSFTTNVRRLSVTRLRRALPAASGRSRYMLLKRVKIPRGTGATTALDITTEATESAGVTHCWPRKPLADRPAAVISWYCTVRFFMPSGACA